jgi:hypothetical protein
MCGLLLGVAQLQGQTLTNGSFENPAVNGANPTGWTTTTANPGLNAKFDSQGESDGTYAFAFNAGGAVPDATLRQDFATIAGQQYYVEFDFRKFAGSAGTAQLQASAINVGNLATLNSLVVSDATGDGDGGLTQNYTTSDFAFTATGLSTRLQFVDQSTGSHAGYDPMLDRASVNIIRNGSFEQNTSRSPTTGNLPTFWTLTNSIGDGVLGLGNFAQGSSDGLDAMAFSFGAPSNPADATLEQTFSTLPGAKYNLTFDFRKFAGGNVPTDVAAVEASLFDLTTAQVLAVFLASDTVGDTGTGQTPADWLNFSVDFTATGTQTTLRFRDLSTGNLNAFDPLLDNVRVSITAAAVPEAASLSLWSLLALVGGIFGWRMRHFRSV